jgi:hypothetical protein
VAEVCGVLHGNHVIGPQDDNGCVLPCGHDGPHEFVDASGRHWLWETDLECDCEHCMRAEGDYCSVYWRKPAELANHSGVGEDGNG